MDVGAKKKGGEVFSTKREIEVFLVKGKDAE